MHFNDHMFVACLCYFVGLLHAGIDLEAESHGEIIPIPGSSHHMCENDHSIAKQYVYINKLES